MRKFTFVVKQNMTTDSVIEAVMAENTAIAFDKVNADHPNALNICFAPGPQDEIVS